MKTLTIEEIEGARKRTADNAVALIDAAELLLRSGFAPQSFFFAHAAVEEIAKIPMLVGVGLDIRAGRTIDWKEVGKRFESHRERSSRFGSSFTSTPTKRSLTASCWPRPAGGSLPKEPPRNVASMRSTPG